MTVKTDSDGFSADEFYGVLDQPYQYYEGDNLSKINVTSYTVTLKCRALNNADFMFVKVSKGIKFMQIYDSDTISSIPRVKHELYVKLSRT